MRRLRSLVLLWCLPGVGTGSSFAQTEGQVQRTASAHLKKISEYRDMGDHDSLLITENHKLMRYLAKVFKENPATLHMKFTKLKEWMDIVTSDDGKVRSYSWPTEFDHSVFDVITQFDTGDGTSVSIDNDVHGRPKDVDLGTYRPTGILSITNAASTIYLVVSEMRVGASTQVENVTAYIIKGGEFETTPVFQSKKGLTESIEYNYDPQGVAHKNAATYIHLDRNGLKLYIPVVHEYYLTNNYLVYVFDGSKFVFDKNAQ